MKPCSPWERFSLGQCFPKRVPWPWVTMIMLTLDWLLALGIINLKTTRQPGAQRMLVCKKRLVKMVHRKRDPLVGLSWVLLCLASFAALWVYRMPQAAFSKVLFLLK